MKALILSAVLASVFAANAGAATTAAKPVDQLDVAKCAAANWFAIGFTKGKTDKESVELYKQATDSYNFSLLKSTNQRLTRTAADTMVADLNATAANGSARDVLVNDYVEACDRIGAF